ncbi:MAG: aldose 1-epimerase family protein [Rhodoglobus sp.]
MNAPTATAAIPAPDAGAVPPPTGQQHVLTRGSSRAVIVEVAAGLREFTIDGVNLTQPYPETVSPPFGCGIVLAPWPNRIEDGQWVLDGHPQQLDLTEPARHNAIHGLLRYAPYTVVERAEAGITLAATVFPQHGYPFYIDTSVRYELVEDGLSVTHTATNRSARRAPVAFGTHPFLTIGDVDPAELVLTVHADTHVEVDARLNPTAIVGVEGTDFDLRAGRRLGDLHLDDGWGGVKTVDGASASLTAPDGREVRLLQDDNHHWIQVFTTRDFPTPDGHSLAVAIEPMTAPVNAFNSGIDVHWIDPSDTWAVAWGIQYVR